MTMTQQKQPDMPQPQHTPSPPRQRLRWYSTGPWTARRTLRAAAITFATCALGAGLAWLSGFDFDARGPEVAAYAATVLAAACMAVMLLGGD